MNVEGLSFKPAKSDAWDGWFAEVKSVLKQLDAGEEQTPEQLNNLGVLLHRLSWETIEALDQMKFENLVKKLWPYRAELTAYRPLKVGIVSNRTLDFLCDPLRAAGLCRQLIIEPILAPLDSAAAIALGNQTIFDGCDAILCWPDATAQFVPGPLLDNDAETAAIDAAVDGTTVILDGLRRVMNGPVFVTTTPICSVIRITGSDLATAGTAARFVKGVNDAIQAGAAANKWDVVDIEALASDIGHRTFFDPLRFMEIKSPYNLSLSPVVADTICRSLAARFGKSKRAAIFDLDNTLWGGVIGDDGVDGIAIGQGSADGESFLEIQRLALELKRRGVALAVCSKNDDAVAREPFKSHPDMLLQESDITVFQAGWEDKATAIKAIADKLRLGLESLAFIDDNPAERARVRQEHPYISVPELSGHPATYPATITASGAFEHGTLNDDDLRRSASYATDAKRAEIREKIGNYDDYLRSLKMVMQIKPFDDVGIQRIVQLVSKSNQFNVTTRRHTEETIRGMMDDPNYLCWQVRLEDAFSEHGMIALLIVKKGPTWTIDTWIQSCRVLERGVEASLMNTLVEQAKVEGVSRLEGLYLPTPKNGIVKDLYSRLGMRFARAQKGGGQLFVLDPAAFTSSKSGIKIV